MGVTDRNNPEKVLSNLAILQTWAAVNPEYNTGPTVKLECYRHITENGKKLWRECSSDITYRQSKVWGDGIDQQR